jgi:homoserine kinase type II
MAVYTQLTNETIASLLSETYGLGELVFAVGIAEGVENTNYLCVVRDARGTETKVILTLYEKRVGAHELPFFLGLMQYLSAQGFACPLPIARADGALFGEVAGRQAAMVTFLNGKSRSLPKNPHVASLGEAVARLHQASAGCILTRENALTLQGWQRLYGAMEGQLNQLYDGLDALVRSELEFLQQHWPHGLPQGIIHADIFPDNVFFEGDDVSGIIDFYFACNDAYAYELAIVVNAWCFEHRSEFNRTKSQLFLQRYQALRPLSAQEKQAFPVLCRGAALRFLLTRAYDALNQQAGALVRVKDPLEYMHKLQFHRRTVDASEYGL